MDFADFAGTPDLRSHPPVNHHGYAAATRGAFLKSVTAVEKRGLKNVILLLRSDLRASKKVLRELQTLGCRVFLSFKESGLHQVSQTLMKPENPPLFRELCALADGALSSTADLVAVYASAGARQTVFIPTPYPLEDKRWNFSVSHDERTGIFVGTREFDIPSRNHLLALSTALRLAQELSQPVTVFNEDGRTGRKRINSLTAEMPGSSVNILEGRRAYPEYLKIMARHRIVWQWDSSSVPGQVAGDALLCRVPCIGGNGTTERLAFPQWTSHGRTLEAGIACARHLLADANAYQEACANTFHQARSVVGFAAVRAQLAAIFPVG